MLVPGAATKQSTLILGVAANLSMLTLGVVTKRMTSQPPSSFVTTLYCSMQAASLGPRAFFFRGMVYKTSLLRSPAATE